MKKYFSLTVESDVDVIPETIRRCIERNMPTKVSVKVEAAEQPLALDECPRCKGSCWVMGINEKIRCPACNGTGIRQ